jgi:hypothetical protein
MKTTLAISALLVAMIANGYAQGPGATMPSGGCGSTWAICQQRAIQGRALLNQIMQQQRNPQRVKSHRR